MPPTDFVSRGQALVTAGQYQEAVKVCRLGLLGRPTTVDGRLVLGQALLALRRYDEVLAEMRVALELEASNAAAHMLKGEALLRKGDAYAALDALEHARGAAPGDPSIAALIEEAEIAIAASGGRGAGGAGFGDFGDSMTKHYPSHRGVGGGDAAGSHSFTRPTAVGGPEVAIAASGMVGGSGTVEIDPDLEGVELLEEEDDVAEPPPPARPITEDIGDSDVVEVEAQDLIGGDGTARLRGRSFIQPDYDDDEATVAERPPRRQEIGHDAETPRPEPARRAPAAAARPAPRQPARLDSVLARSAAAIDELFPDEESALHAAAPEAEAEPAGPRVSRADDMHTIRAALGLDPSGPRPAVAARPESTGVVAGRAATPRPDGRQSSGTGLVKSGAVRRVPVAHRRVTTILWAAVATLLLGGGVAAGFYARGVVLERGVTETRAAAASAAHADSWRGWQVARDDLIRIADARGGAEARAAVARARAVLAADFGYDPDGARAAAKGDASGAVVARAYVTLLDGDATGAAAAADQARRAVGGALGDYLVGRAALVGERWDDAHAAFDQAVNGDPRPAYYLGRAAASAGAGRYREALADCDRALGKDPSAPGGVPGHVRALIERARIVAASSASPEQLAAAAAGLDEIAAEAARPTAQQALGVSPLEQALASLARAELEHARGDDAAARRDLERAGTAAGDDLIVADGVIDLHLALGDEARAVELAQRAAATWPKSQRPRIALAAAALAAGDAGKALDALTKAGDVSDRPVALALRGRAHLAAGDLDAAAKDLDAALARMPDDEATLQARAEVDLARGDAKTAVTRLAKRAGATAASPSLLVTYASALRASGQHAQAKKLLDKLTQAGDVGGIAAGRAWLERARLATAEADLATAHTDYQKAIGALPRGTAEATRARLEAAVLQVDSGDAITGRAALDRLVADVPADGRVLVEAARAHIVTGDPAGGKDLLDRADKTASAARWRIARERGRLALRTRSGPDAVQALDRAASLAPDDGDTRLMLIDAELMTRNEKGARKVLDDVLKRFHGKPAAKLAAGRLAYYFSHDAEARKAFGQARDQLVKAKARPRAVADATYWLGRVRYDDNPDEARRLLLQATSLDPTLADAYVFLGLIDSDKNDPHSAVLWFQKATQLDPDNVDSWFDLGQAASLAKDKTEAKRAYTEYLKRAPGGEYTADVKAALQKL